jgi:endonuclease G
MAPAEDFSRSDEAIKTSFLLSNIVPQFQGVNGGRWAQLELVVRNIVRDSGTAYVSTGPIFALDAVDTIGDGEVGIPHTRSRLFWPSRRAAQRRCTP